MNATWWNAPQDERFNEPGQEPDVEGMAKEYIDRKAEGLSLKLHDMSRDDLTFVIEELWDAIYNKEWSEPPDSIEAILVRYDLSWHQIKVAPSPEDALKDETFKSVHTHEHTDAFTCGHCSECHVCRNIAETIWDKQEEDQE